MESEFFKYECYECGNMFIVKPMCKEPISYCPLCGEELYEKNIVEVVDIYE